MTKEKMIDVACDEFARLRKIEWLKEDLKALNEAYYEEENHGNLVCIRQDIEAVEEELAELMGF